MFLNKRHTGRFLAFLIIAPAFLSAAYLAAEPLYSPTWGFRIDLPEGYEYTEGNNFDRYSFEGPGGAKFDIAVYDGVYSTVREMASDINRRLENKGDNDFFNYWGKSAAMMELRFQNYEGWGIGVELDPRGDSVPLLVALAYAPAGKAELDLFHMSALDSIIPSDQEMRRPGIIMEFGFPRGQQRETAIALTDLKALVWDTDAEAAQVLVDREYAVLCNYQFAECWQEAWIRFYRMIYRDSWDRVSDAVFRLERSWNTGEDRDPGGRTLAEKALAWVQSFKYERDPEGSDFVNLVSAVTEGRGDCDSRSMLWVMILSQANIPAAIMVSQNYSHAMGLADVPGEGARFEAAGIQWLVAETTDKVGIGLISQDMSDIGSWLGVFFE